jgi:gliding motility-associated-like protein
LKSLKIILNIALLLFCIPNNLVAQCAPITINGPTFVCPGATNNYTVSGIPPGLIDFYSLGPLPGGFGVICGFNVVAPGNLELCLADGAIQLCIYYDNNTCVSCIDIFVTSNPINSITGPAQVCGGDTETYTLNPTLPSNITVTYSVTNGTVISSDNGQATVQWNANQTSGQICASVPFCGSTQTICQQVTISQTPTGNPVTLSDCADPVTGLATFNLTNSDATIGNGFNVSWFQDIDLTIPITNPSSFMTGTTTIYAVVSNGGCPSAPIPINIIVSNPDPSGFLMSISPNPICPLSAGDNQQITVSFILPSPGTYTYQYQLECGSNTTNGSVTSSTGSFDLTVNSNCTLNVLSITSASGCQTTFNPPLTDIINYVNPPNITVLSGFNFICQGQSIDLNDYLVVSFGDVTWHSGFPTTPSNQLPSGVVSPNTATIYYAQITYDGCFRNTGFPVNVDPSGPTFTTSQSICQNASNVDLTQFLSPPTLQGTWSGQGVTGSIFNPAGLSGSIEVTFDPVNPCLDNGVVTFEITTPQTPVLGTTQICESSDPISLNILTDPLFPNGNWSGPGVTNNNFDPSNLSATVTLTFTPTTACINPATTIISILPNPQFSVSTNVVVCTNASINLEDYVNTSAGLNLTFHNGLPATISNQLSSTLVIIGANTTYYVKATNTDGCITIVPLNITVSPGGIPVLGTATLCENQNNFDLNALNDPLAGPGIWAGIGVSSNILDLTLQSGTINLSFIPNNTCFSASNTTVNVVENATPILTSTSMCSENGSFPLINLQDPNYPNGSWSGPNVVNNIFNPQNLSGNTLLTFTSTDFCVSPAFTNINVILSETPVLSSTEICETVTLLDLSTLGDPDFNSGTWYGDGVNGNDFAPSGLLGTILLTFISDQQCVLPASTTIVVNGLQTPVLQDATLCFNAAPLNLSTLSGNFPAGEWSGNGVLDNVFYPNQNIGLNSLTFVADAACTLPATTEVLVQGIPSFENLEVNCNNGVYNVSFTITGGDPNGYFINGNLVSSEFTSGSIVSNTPYLFTLSDINQCGTTIIQGNKNCDCSNDPGTMDFAFSPLRVCISDTARAVFNNNSVINNGTVLRFVLHDSPSSQLGNIFAQSSSPEFVFPSNGVFGQIYYISSVSGTLLSNGNIDSSDPCFSASAGIPVVFYQPDISLGKVDPFCIENCIDVLVNFNGEGPFNMSYEITNGLSTVVKDTLWFQSSQNSVAFCPENFNLKLTETVSFKIISTNDKNCEMLPPPLQNLIINNKRTNTITQSLCENNTININGTVYDKNNTSGQEIIISNNTAVCDSIIDIKLNILKNTSFTLDNEICNNQSIIVNGNIYNKDRLTGQEIIANTLGCDSVINVRLKYVDQKVQKINSELCQGEAININGTIYDIANPKGQEILINGAQNGCDSIIDIDLKFLPPAVNNLSLVICPHENVNINGEIFDINNTQKQIILSNASVNGCDSIINIQLSFYEETIDTLMISLFTGQSTMVNGQLFNYQNREGLTLFPDVTMNGCRKYQYVIINFNQESISAQISSAPETCPESKDGSIIIENITGCTNYKVKINGIIYENINLPWTLKNLPPNNYNVEITGDFQCSFKTTIQVDKSTSTGFEVDNNTFTVEENQVTRIELDIIPIPENINWLENDFLSCFDCLNPVLADLQRDTLLAFTLTDDNGCKYENQIFVKVNPKKQNLVFPNIFSPNGDGQNDLYIFNNTLSQNIEQVSIFDRWGNMVFSESNIEAGESMVWDGTMNQGRVTPGVYIMVAQFTSDKKEKEIISGSITVVY